VYIEYSGKLNAKEYPLANYLVQGCPKSKGKGIVKNRLLSSNRISDFFHDLILIISESWKFRSWLVLFDLLLDPFVSSFARANVISLFEYDTEWFIDISTGILINAFSGLEFFPL
jgi:hypothetical protein